MAIESHEVLFIGWSKMPICWYRCAMPAMYLGADWVGVARGDHIKDMVVQTGVVRGESLLPQLDDYKVIVIQQPFERVWLPRIEAMHKKGVKVLFEIDDYVHNIPKSKDHDYRLDFSREHLRAFELCMRVCDGVICSTEYLARRYRRYNQNVYVCQNGLDMGRYELTRPKRDWTAIGWAGATGHTIAVVNWLNGAVLDVMEKYDDTHFVAVGSPAIADVVGEVVGEDRTLGTPWTSIENYPAAMCHIDIAIAPAGESAWFRAKSNLRFLEASALGIPVIGDPVVYAEIEDGVTGFKATTAAEARLALEELLDDPTYAAEVGAYARQYVRKHRDIRVMCGQWMEVAEAITA